MRRWLQDLRENPHTRRQRLLATIWEMSRLFDEITDALQSEIEVEADLTVFAGSAVDVWKERIRQGRFLLERIETQMEALDAELVSTDSVADISVLSLKPDDVIVVKVKARLAPEKLHNLQARLRAVFRDRPVSILDESVTMSVVTGELET